MSETLPEFNPERELEGRLVDVAAAHLEEDDVLFLDDLEDFDARVGYIYGRLLESYEDPYAVLYGYGLFDEDDDEV